MFSVKDSTSKRSWLQSFFNYINDTIKCKDDIYIYSSVSNQPIRFPPQTEIRAVLKTLKQQITRIKIINCFFKILKHNEPPPGGGGGRPLIDLNQLIDNIKKCRLHI